MLVDITSITTITNNLAVNTLQICHNFEKKMSLNTPYLGLYILLISALQNAGNAISEVSEIQTFPGVNPPTPLKGCRHSYFAPQVKNRFYGTVVSVQNGKMIESCLQHL